MTDAPLVSCVVATYNYGRFLPATIDSVLAQDYPADRLEIVIVDDGSTDDTMEILGRYADEHPGRFVIVAQANARYAVAMTNAIEQASGDYVAVLDADDVWLPHKTRAQVELFEARPELSMVYGDMRIIDHDGRVTTSSLLHQRADYEPPSGWIRGMLIRTNVATASTIMLRGDQKAAYCPLPDQYANPYGDWSLAAAAAAVGEVALLDEPLALYRRHDANTTATAADVRGRLRDLRYDLRQARWLAAHTREQEVSVADMTAALEMAEWRAGQVLEIGGSPFTGLTEVTEADREAAVCELGAGGRDVQRLFAAFRAVGHDAYSTEARQRLGALLARFDNDAAGVITANARSYGARPVLVLAEAAELVAQPSLLDTLAALDASAPATVAITVDEDVLETTVAELQSALGAHGLDGEDAPDLVAFACPPAIVQQLPAGTADAILTTLPRRGVFPCFGPGDGAALAAFVTAQATIEVAA